MFVTINIYPLALATIMTVKQVQRYILSTISTDHMAGSELTFSVGSILLILIGSIVLSLMTVLISIRKPAE